MSRGMAGEGLPALHDHIDVGGVELEPQQTRPVISAAIRLVPEPRTGRRSPDRAGVVDDWPAHAFTGFCVRAPNSPGALGYRMGCCWGSPDRRLRAVAIPLAALAVAHRVRAGLMLPVIIPTAQGEVLLTQTICARSGTRNRQAQGDDIAVRCSVPHRRRRRGQRIASAQSARSSSAPCLGRATRR